MLKIQIQSKLSPLKEWLHIQRTKGENNQASFPGGKTIYPDLYLFEGLTVVREFFNSSPLLVSVNS